MTLNPPASRPARAARAAGHPAPPPLRCSTFLAPHLFWLYECVADALGRRLGRPVELVEGTGYGQLADGVDFAFVCGLPYVQWAHAVEPLAAPVLAGARYGGRPVYFSDVVVRHDSDVETFADLRGRSWAYNEPDSQSGHGVVRFHLAQMGETCAFFGRLVEAGWHERALRLVAEGAIDAAAIDSHVLETYLRQHPQLAGRLRVIATLGPSPIQPLVADRRLPAALKAAARAAAVELAADPEAARLLHRARVERFVPVGDADYGPIRAMLRAVAAVEARSPLAG